jgi:CDP-diacylglycerol--glycerol-3-phosphate 3-phosphatidyltransferase
MRELPPLERACLRLGAVGVAAVLAVVGVAVRWAPDRAAPFAALSLTIWLVVAGTLWRAAARAGSGIARLGAATRLTALRGLLVSLVAGFVSVPPDGAARWLPAILYAAAAALDNVDGRVARRRGETTALGAYFDEAMDALGLLAAPAVAVAWGRLPPWYLLLGAAYYVYRGALALRRRLGLPLYPERVSRRPLTRVFAGAQMVLVAVALAPLVSPAVLSTLATLLMMPTLAFFVRDWLLVTGRRAPVPALVALR